MYADKDTLKRALTNLHEQVLDDPPTLLLFGGAVLVREISARTRMAAQEAANAETPDNPDQILYQAMLIQQSVVDPASGRPYADGRIDENGAPLVDPRTRAPMFTVDETLEIAGGREIAVRELINSITSLSALGPSALRFRGHTDDGGERNAGESATQPGDPIGEAADLGPGDTDERGALDAGAIEGTGDTVSADA